MKDLFKYLKPYTKESILAPAFKLVEALLDLLVPVIIARIINFGIKTGDKQYIIIHFVFLIGLAIIGLGQRFGRSFLPTFRNYPLNNLIKSERRH